MKVVFGLLESYAQAAQVVGELLERGLSASEMNAILLAEVRDRQEIDREVAAAAAGEELPGPQMSGLDRLVGTQQAVRTADAGEIVAGGDVATIVAGTATAPGEVSRRLADALADVNVPEELAGRYVEGIRGGGVLLWVRSPDERSAEVENVLRAARGGNADTYAV